MTTQATPIKITQVDRQLVLRTISWVDPVTKVVRYTQVAVPLL